jgi:adenylosuccinate synthase
VSATRYASVLGLGFGDCGKGHFVNALTRKWGAHTVVRFCGGAQAGHHVATSEGLHHTFSQFGAGTLVAGTRTLLLDPMIVHPTGLLVEAEALGKIGAGDALSRLKIDGRCRLTTPFHQAAGRLREWLRGDHAHGTCGVGVGETVRHALEHPGQELRYQDLISGSGSPAMAAVDKLQSIRETLFTELRSRFPASNHQEVEMELRVFEDENLAGRWLNLVRALVRQCPPASEDEIADLLRQPGCVLFEGAQGVLLDEWRGFHPHTTWSSTTADALDEAVAGFHLPSPIEHYGVLRTYPTRHGIGPFPTGDESLANLLPEPDNLSEGWQGRFRRGHPDAVMLRYAIEAAGDLSGLLVSHLDVFQRGVALKWCGHYSDPANAAIERLPLGRRSDLVHQEMLTGLLARVRPEYASECVRTDNDFLDRLSGVTPLPVVFRSYGNTCEDVCGPAYA